MKRYISIFFASLFTLNSHADPLQQQAAAMFGPLPDKMPGSEQDTLSRINLGKQLYFETALSLNGQQSCNSCHVVNNAGSGVDNEPTSPGALGERGDRNSPTVWNAGFHLAQFWDGRAADLHEQAKGPILNPIEMAIPNEDEAIKRLSANGYKAAFAKAFPAEKEPMNYETMAEAISAFERTLISEDRFNKFMTGDATALNTQEKRGLQAFINNGCTACHSGPTLGGKMYMKMGLINAYENKDDLGRFSVTQNPADKYVFKVPSLRMIGQTAPYFHDGKAATLEEAVEQMAWLQLGRKLNKNDVQDIAAFLHTMDNTARSL